MIVGIRTYLFRTATFERTLTDKARSWAPSREDGAVQASEIHVHPRLEALTSFPGTGVGISRTMDFARHRTRWIEKRAGDRRFELLVDFALARIFVFSSYFTVDVGCITASFT